MVRIGVVFLSSIYQSYSATDISALSLNFAEWSPVVQTIASARHILSCTPERPSNISTSRKRNSSINEWIKIENTLLDDAKLGDSRAKTMA